MTYESHPWGVPGRGEPDKDSWSFVFTRESEAMDTFAIPLDRTEALAAALGMPTDVVVDQLENRKPEPALIEAWQSLVGTDREVGIARLEAAGLAPRQTGTWTPSGDYGIFVALNDDVAVPNAHEDEAQPQVEDTGFEEERP